MNVVIYKLKNGYDIIGKKDLENKDKIILKDPLFLIPAISNGNLVISFRKLNEPYSQVEIEKIDITGEILYKYNMPVEEIINQYLKVITGLEIKTNLKDIDILH